MTDGQARDPATGRFLPKTAKVRGSRPAVRWPSDVHGALKEGVRLPAIDTFFAKPGFEPHDQLTTALGESGSYFWHWERLYDRNPLFATVCQVFRDLVMSMGFRFHGEERFERIWDAWVSESNFLIVLSELVLESKKNGNGMGALVRQTGRLLDLRVQTLPARGFFPKLNEDKTGYDRFVFRWPSIDDPYDPRFGEGWVLPINDVLHLKNNGSAGTFFGRAVGYQSHNLLVEIMELAHVFAVMAKRSSHGLLHFKVNIDGLSTEPVVNPDTGAESASPASQKIRAVSEIGDQRVQIDREHLVARISNDLYTDHTVEIKAIELKNDMEGVQKSVDTLLRLVDRSLRIPRNILGEGEGSNKATAREQNRMLAAVLKSDHAVICEMIADTLFPELGIPSTCYLGIDEEILSEDGELANSTRDAIGRLVNVGILTIEEAREELSPDLRSEIDSEFDTVPLSVEIPNEKPNPTSGG